MRPAFRMADPVELVSHGQTNIQQGQSIYLLLQELLSLVPLVTGCVTQYSSLIEHLHSL